MVESYLCGVCWVRPFFVGPKDRHGELGWKRPCPPEGLSGADHGSRRDYREPSGTPVVVGITSSSTVTFYSSRPLTEVDSTQGLLSHPSPPDLPLRSGDHFPKVGSRRTRSDIERVFYVLDFFVVRSSNGRV